MRCQNDKVQEKIKEVRRGDYTFFLLFTLPNPTGVKVKYFIEE